MGSHVVVQKFDDITGQTHEDVETITFTWHGQEYEIEVNTNVATALDSTYHMVRSYMDELISHARKVPKAKRKSPAPKAASTGAEIRAWAKNNGYDVPQRGVIPNHIKEAYEKALAKPATLVGQHIIQGVEA